MKFCVFAGALVKFHTKVWGSEEGEQKCWFRTCNTGAVGTMLIGWEVNVLPKGDKFRADFDGMFLAYCVMLLW